MHEKQFGKGSIMKLGDFKTIEHYDLCDKHYEIFRDWIKRNKMKNKE